LLQTSNVGGYWRSLLRHKLLHPRLLERLRLSLLALLTLLTLLPWSPCPSLTSLTLLPSPHRRQQRLGITRPSLRLQRLHRRIHLLRRPLLSPLSRRLCGLRELLQHRKLSGVDSTR
jgi:hypothetical protein